MKIPIAFILTVAAASVAFGFHPNPSARPGPDPSVRSFSEEEVQAQQAGPKVFTQADGGAELGTPDSSEIDMPSGYDDGGTLAKADHKSAKSESAIDGKQVMKQAQQDIERRGQSGMLRAVMGLLIFGTIGFGCIAFARNWAEKNAPRPEVRTKVRKRTHRIS